MKHTLAIVAVFAIVSSIVGLTLQVDRALLHKQRAPQHVTCYPSAPSALQGSSGPEYLPLFALDAVDAPDLSSTDSDVALVNGLTVRVHTGGATCFSLPLTQALAPPHAAPPAPPAPPAASTSDAGPVK